MTNIAVTNHAVDRYRERVDGAKVLDKESARSIIRKLVEEGFTTGSVSENPHYRGRMMVPFVSGKSVLYLSIGDNNTSHDGELAVIGVLYEHETTGGKIGTGATIEDALRVRH